MSSKTRTLQKLDNFEQIFKKFKIKKSKGFNRFWRNSIPKVGWCIIFVFSFRTIAQFLQKLELLQTFFKKFYKSHKISNRWSIFMKIVKIEGAWLLHWCTKSQSDISRCSWVIVVYWSKVKNRIYTHINQLKITFLDVSEYSQYSDSNISIFFTKA